MTQRRLMLAGLAGLASSVCVPSRQALAQVAARTFRVGLLRPSAPPALANDPQASGIPDALRALGYVEGRNLVLEQRWAHGDLTRLPALALELAQAKVDVIVAVSAPAVVAVRDGDYARAFASIAAERATALFVGAHTFFVRDRREIIALAAKHRLAAVYEWREQVEDGGLMTYSTSLRWTYERVAASVDRILKGTPPSEIAVERPSTFAFVINLKTAKALGLSVPQALLLRADEVIQ